MQQWVAVVCVMNGWMEEREEAWRERRKSKEAWRGVGGEKQRRGAWL